MNDGVTSPAVEARCESPPGQGEGGRSADDDVGWCRCDELEPVGSGEVGRDIGTCHRSGNRGVAVPVWRLREDEIVRLGLLTRWDEEGEGTHVRDPFGRVEGVAEGLHHRPQKKGVPDQRGEKEVRTGQRQDFNGATHRMPRCCLSGDALARQKMTFCINSTTLRVSSCETAPL